MGFRAMAIIAYCICVKPFGHILFDFYNEKRDGVGSTFISIWLRKNVNLFEVDPNKIRKTIFKTLRSYLNNCTPKQIWEHGRQMCAENVRQRHSIILADAKSTPAYFSDLHFLGLIMQLWTYNIDPTEGS